MHDYKVQTLAKKLKVNKHFIPCEVADGDEIFRNGIFEFNISKLSDYLASERSCIGKSSFNVSEFPYSYSRIDESHIDSVDITKPVIIAEIAPQRYNIIDGNHRVEKARRAGVKILPCYRLTVEKHLPFLIDEKAYGAYVEYWNSKVCD
jgi:hypothetical protein